MGNRARVLIAGPDALERLALAAALADDEYTVLQTCYVQGALTACREQRIDVLLLDGRLLDLDDGELVSRLRALCMPLPPLIIVLSDGADADAVVACLTAGADECLARPMDPRELRARVAAGLRTRRTLDDMRRDNDRLRALALTDPLTGLPNRRSFEAWLGERRGSVGGEHVAGVIVADLDRLKAVNDTHGHLAGDQAIRAVAARLREAVRPTDIVARIGGDEFVIGLAGCTASDVRRVAARLQIEVRRSAYRVHTGIAVRPSITLGLAVRSDAATVEALFDVADQRLYAAKRARAAARTQPGPAPAGVPESRIGHCARSVRRAMTTRAAGQRRRLPART